MKLPQLVQITSGINNKRNPQGSVYYLGASDFVSATQLDKLITPSIYYSEKLEKHFLKKGDVLILSKGHHGFPAFLFNDETIKAVASSVFLVLRETVKEILPEYVSWYINLKSTQQFLIRLSRGSALPAINKKIVESLDIPVIPLQQQQQIIAISKLKEQESALVQQIDILKSLQIEKTLKETLFI